MQPRSERPAGRTQSPEHGSPGPAPEAPPPPPPPQPPAATGQYASVQLVHFPQPVRRTPDSDRGAGRAASNGQTA
ncbi:hypothetical protein G4228_009887 [Cervus hanglu yarkandensis]|nr:hypothetical protein G4228_009887 [Cervus hanglu yarkandensis]